MASFTFTAVRVCVTSTCTSTHSSQLIKALDKKTNLPPHTDAGMLGAVI